MSQVKTNPDATLIADYIARALRFPLYRDGKLIGFQYVPIMTATEYARAA